MSDITPDQLMKTLIDTRMAMEWFMFHDPGTPIPEWVDAAVNDIDRDVYMAMVRAGFDPESVFAANQ